MNTKRTIGQALLAAVAAFALTGCHAVPAKVTGGGTFGGASFGFNANSCSPSGKVHGQFQYNDHAGVKFHGVVLSAVGGGSSCAADEIQVNLAYKAKGGEGSAVVCLHDGEDDAVALLVTSGPYAGYSNGGSVRGNVKVHDCD